MKKMLLITAVLLVAGFGCNKGINEVVYVNGNLNHEGKICIPEGEGPHPAVVFNHGGLNGTIGGAPEKTCEALAAAGFVGFSPIRREATALQGHLDGVFAALDHVKGLNYVDTERVGMMGFSRGGLLTFMAMTKRPDIAASVIMAPAPGNGALQKTFPDIGGITAPSLILVAENDTVQANHVQSSRQLRGVLESAGKHAQLIVYPAYKKDGHQMFFEVGDYWDDVEMFLNEHLK